MGLVSLVRRQIVLDEDRAALAVLAAPSPCDDCPYREQCIDEEVVCKRFVAYVWGVPEWRWRRIKQTPPSHRWYLEAHAEEPPAWLRLATSEGDQERMCARIGRWRTELFGREFNGRRVVDVVSRGRMVAAVLHCDACGKDALRSTSDVRRGNVPRCACVHAHEWGRAYATAVGEKLRAEFVGKHVRNGWHCIDIVHRSPRTRHGQAAPYLVLKHDVTGDVIEQLPHRARRGIGLHLPGTKYFARRIRQMRRRP